MAQQLNARPISYIVLIAVVDQPNVLTQIKVEQRDFQYRLVSRHQSSPLTGGGAERILAEGMGLWSHLVSDALPPDASPLGSEGRLDA